MSSTPDGCSHDYLTFESGGFYVSCLRCRARWGAQVDTPQGTKADYDRVNMLLDGQIRGPLEKK